MWLDYLKSKNIFILCTCPINRAPYYILGARYAPAPDRSRNFWRPAAPHFKCLQSLCVYFPHCPGFCSIQCDAPYKWRNHLLLCGSAQLPSEDLEIVEFWFCHSNSTFDFFLWSSVIIDPKYNKMMILVQFDSHQ